MLTAQLQHPRVRIEDIRRIGISAGCLAHQQRYLTAHIRVALEIVQHHQYIPALSQIGLRYRHRGVGCILQHGRAVVVECREDDRIFHRASAQELAVDVLDLLFGLAYRRIDAEHIPAALVQYRIQRDLRLACLFVSDYELSLTAPYRIEHIYAGDAGMQRARHGGSVHDGDGRALDGDIRQLSQPLARELVLSEDIHDMTYGERRVLHGKFLSRSQHPVADMYPPIHARERDEHAVLPHRVYISLGVVAYEHMLKICRIVQTYCLHDILAHERYPADPVGVGALLYLCDLSVDHIADRMLH